MGDAIVILPGDMSTKMVDGANSIYVKQLGGIRLAIHCFPDRKVPLLGISVDHPFPSDGNWNYESVWFYYPCQDTLALFYTGLQDDFMAPLIDWLQEHNTDEYNAGVLERAALLYCQ